ncbi:MAG: caspase family protein [Bacteroidetes bacterium]|nr:caspase family protein [Bacteroidota bacterium]
MKNKQTLLSGKYLLQLLFLFAVHLAYSQKAELSVQTGHSGNINKLAFSPNGKLLASSGSDNKVVIWDIASGNQYNSFVVTSNSTSGLVFYQDSIVITSNSDSSICYWNVHSGKLLNRTQFPSYIYSIDVSQKAGKLLVGSLNLSVIDLVSSKVSNFDVSSSTGFNVVKFDASGTEIFTGGKDETFCYLFNFDANTNKLTQLRKLRNSAISANFDSEGTIYYTTNDGKALGYDPKKETKFGTTSDFPTNTFNDIKINNNIVYTCNNKGAIDAYQKRNWVKQISLIDHTEKVNVLALNSDGSILASSGNDKKIILWNTSNFKPIKVLEGSVKQINVVKFTPNCENILIGYNDGAFRVSNIKTNASKSAQLTLGTFKKKTGWSYFIYDFSSISNDSATVHFVLAHRSGFYDGVFDELEEYTGLWSLKTGVFTVNKNPLKTERFEKYISNLKKGKIPSITDALNNELLSSKSQNTTITSKGKLLLIENASQPQNKIESSHADYVSSLAINEKYGFFASSSWDGLIKFYDIKTGEQLCSYGAFGKSNFIYINKDNYYFASKGALDDISFRYNNRIYAFDQFDLKYNRPDKAIAKLPYINKVVLTNYEKAYAKRLKKLGISEKDLNAVEELPELKVTLPENLITTTGGFSFKVSCTEKKLKLENLHVLVNGVPLYSRYGKPIPGKEFSGDVQLTLPSGNNYIQVHCTNSKGTNSLKETFVITSEVETKKPDLYLITIGASEYQQKNFNLKYAAKDANDIVTSLSKLKTFNSIKTKTLVNADVTLNNVKALESFVAQASENDMVIIFAAGHGVLDKELDYYFATYDIDFANPAVNGIPYDVFQDILDKTKSRKKIMFLDACHSGEIDKDEVKKTQEVKSDNGVVFRSAGENIENQEMVNTFELSKNTFADVGLSNGASMISSAGGTEYAMEGAQWNNGVFTYALLNGIKNNACDLNKDKKIMLSELQEYLLNEVQTLTKGKQTPTSRNENLIFDYQIK